jgi:hypothetical protein
MMDEGRRNPLVRFFEFIERLPFRHGEAMLVKMDNEHPPVSNHGTRDMPLSEVPDALQAEAIEKERRRRASNMPAEKGPSADS